MRFHFAHYHFFLAHCVPVPDHTRPRIRSALSPPLPPQMRSQRPHARTAVEIASLHTKFHALPPPIAPTVGGAREQGPFRKSEKPPPPSSRPFLSRLALPPALHTTRPPPLPPVQKCALARAAASIRCPLLCPFCPWERPTMGARWRTASYPALLPFSLLSLSLCSPVPHHTPFTMATGSSAGSIDPVSLRPFHCR